MNNSEKYNGWTNAETWSFALHIDNDEGLQSMVTNAVAEIMQDDTYDIKSYQVAEYLKDLMDQLKEWRFDGGVNTEVIAIVYDIGSAWRIDYREVAEHYITTYNENK